MNFPEDFLRHLCEERDPLRSEDDPSKFDRYCQIDNDSMLLLLSEYNEQVKVFDKKRDVAEIYAQEAAVEKLKAEVLKSKIFIELGKLYPEIKTQEMEHSGFRKFQGKEYYVAWRHRD